MDYVEFLQQMTLYDLCKWIFCVATLVSFIIEKSKKLPFNPWTSLLSSIGNKLNKVILDDLEELKNQTEENKRAIEALNLKVDEQGIEADTKEAKRLRADIISYADSCMMGQRHTQSQFEEFFRKVGDYNSYCKKRNIPNHFIDSEVEYVRGVFDECAREHKFTEEVIVMGGDSNREDVHTI